ncbi:MAG: outer membrane beta-barrel protein [Burkholderiales bacterium]
MIRIHACLAAFLYLLVSGVQAETQHYFENYYGAGGGLGKVRKYCEPANRPAGFSGVCDDSNSGFRVFGGYKFNPYLGIELGYTNFARGRRDGTPASATGLWKGYGVGLSAAAFLPLGDQVELMAKAGIVGWNIQSPNGQLSSSSTIDDRGFSLTAGIGATWFFIPQVGLRLEFERFQNVGDQATVGRFNVDHLSLNVVGRF